MFSVKSLVPSCFRGASPAPQSETAAPPEVPADLVILREVVLNNAEAWSKQSLPALHTHGTWGDTPFALTVSSSGRPQTPLYVRGTVGDRKLDVAVANECDDYKRAITLKGIETAADGRAQDVRGELYVDRGALSDDRDGKFVNSCSVGNSHLRGAGKVQPIANAIEGLYKNPQTLAGGQSLQNWQTEGIRYVGREEGVFKSPEHSATFLGLTSLGEHYDSADAYVLEHCTLGQTMFETRLNETRLGETQEAGSRSLFPDLQGQAFGKPLTFIQDTTA